MPLTRSAEPAPVRIKRGRRPDPNRDLLVARVHMLLDEGASITDACETLGIAPASYYRWRGREAAGPMDEDVARKLIIDAAKAGFMDQGMDVSLSAIAEAAGVARQTIYNLYGSKKSLLLGVLRDIYAGLLLLDHDPEETDPMPEVFDLFGRRFLAMAVDDDALMVNRLAISQYRKDTEISGMIFELASQNSLTGLTARLAVYLERQQALGRANTGDPQLIAVAFQSAIMGAVRLRALAGMAQSQHALDAHLACTTELFLRGLAVPGD